MEHLTVSLFNGAKDIWPKAVTLTWERLCQNLAITYPYHPELNTPLDKDGAKKATRAISQAVYREGTTRGIGNIDHVDCLIYDFDNKNEEPVAMATIGQLLQSQGLACFLYHTYSSTPQLEKFRVVVPLEASFYTYFDNPINWLTFTEWSLSKLNINQYRHCIDLEKHLHNPASMAFLQCCPDPSNLLCYGCQGAPLAWSVEEVETFPLPPIVQSSLEQVNQAQRGDLSWAKPFPINFKTLDLPALLQANGYWVGPPKQTPKGTKWECQCPWEAEHNHLGRTAGIIKSDGHWPGWSCFHTHQKVYSIKDIAELFGPEQLAQFAEQKQTRLRAGSLI